MHLGGQLGSEAAFGRKVRGLKVTAAEAARLRRARRCAATDERRTDGESFATWVARADEDGCTESHPSDRMTQRRESGMTERAAPFYCPYCGEEDLRPSARRTAQWRCGTASGSSPCGIGIADWSTSVAQPDVTPTQIAAQPDMTATRPARPTRPSQHRRASHLAALAERAGA